MLRGVFMMAVLGGIDARLNGQKVALAFVDAIHTDAFVSAQIDMLLDRAEPGVIIVLDDDMKKCWIKWANDKRVSASVSVANRVGIIEFAN